VGFVVDKVALGQVFSEYFGFPCTIFITPNSPQSPSHIIRGWYNRPVMAAVPKSPTAQIKKKSVGGWRCFCDLTFSKLWSQLVILILCRF
jgi:hypothetical protein